MSNSYTYPSYKLLFFRGLVLLTGLLAGYSVHPAYAENRGMSLLKNRCVSCHNLTGPAARTLTALRSRKAPDMFYAGDKYNHEWLKIWLQHPVQIRPTNMFHTVQKKNKSQPDDIGISKQQTHMALNTSDALLAADTLMRLKSNTIRINAALHQPKGFISEKPPRGQMFFNNIYKCIACHQTAPGHGGLSGPELYSARTRLTAAFIRSYIHNPQLWAPKIGMANIHISKENIEKLTRYIMSISTQRQDNHVK